MLAVDIKASGSSVAPRGRMTVAPHGTYGSSLAREGSILDLWMTAANPPTIVKSTPFSSRASVIAGGDDELHQDLRGLLAPVFPRVLGDLEASGVRHGHGGSVERRA